MTVYHSSFEMEYTSSTMICDSLSAVMSPERPITLDEACALRLLLFGDLNISFGTEWSEQSFHFRRNKPLSYGIIQKKPGPCGILAAVQAYVLRELLFGNYPVKLEAGLLRPNIAEKRIGLSLALTTIIWQAGDSKRGLVAIKKRKLALNKNIFREDGILEHLHIKYFDCRTCLFLYYYTHISEIMDDNNGSCILFLYSLILTHGIETIKKEMDFPDSHLIGSDGYCSQEIINLLLVGKATPNLFDGEVELNSGGSETSIHRGIPNQSLIGLLSVLDYQNTCPVGNHYKNPVYPIFLLLYDSHFTVLFGTSSDVLDKIKPDDSFTLYHYDGLQKKNIEPSFLIKPVDETKIPPDDIDLPAVIKCIYTRWPLASMEIQLSSNMQPDEENYILN